MDVNDASQQIAQNCPTGGSTPSELGEFVVTGRGGLPPNPIEVLGSETVLTQLAATDDDIDPALSSTDAIDRVSHSELSTHSIAEAQGWVINAEGQVALVAHTPHSPSLVPPSCTANNPS